MTTAHLPSAFLWGAATAGHQNDGGDTMSDTTFLENVEPTVFREAAGVGCGTWERWPEDLDLAAEMGFSAFRFSVEWARVEPERGVIDRSALDRYDAMVDRCLALGMSPVVTFSHFTAPHWFACRGGWPHADAPADFAAFCEVVMDRIGDRVAMAVTLNEPNLPRILEAVLPAQAWGGIAATLDAADRAAGVERYRAGNVVRREELDLVEAGFERAHIAARDAIRARRPELPVGMSLAVMDEVALPGGEARREAIIDVRYARWYRLVEGDDFLGVQNYERAQYGPEGVVVPEGGETNEMGSPVEPESLAGAVRMCHAATSLPILVSEHGLATADDDQRARFIPAALEGLDKAMADGVPVLGYLHWTFLDNFEWIAGYSAHFGLVEVDRETLERRPKPSSRVYAAEIRARRGAPAEQPVR
mgnify:FL=1